MTSLSNLKTHSILSQSLEDAFPAVDPGNRPLGSLVLLQIKSAATRTKAGLILTQDTVETESDNTRIAKVIALGPLAYHTRDTATAWPEGAWCRPGDYVRIGLYGGDRWRVLVSSEKDARGAVTKMFAEFALVEDLNIKALVTGDPLAQLAFI